MVFEAGSQGQSERHFQPKCTGIANMEFVNVLKSPKPYTNALDMMPSLLKHNKGSLISLKDGYDSDISAKGIDSFHKAMCRFSQEYGKYDPTKWIDSGGYSFIKGKFGSKHIPKLIESYHYYLKKYNEDFDFIFSLDFPFNEKDKSFNTDLKAIRSANFSSLDMSVKAIYKNEELRKKFYFVHQFLKDGFYEIWRDLYRQLNIADHVSNYAIGGMVGIRANKRAVPSPFIGVSYRILLDFLKIISSKSVAEFRLHFLGVYLVQDRFSIILLERLFAKYLSQTGKEAKPVFTYDSSTYTRRGKRGHYSLSGFFEYDDGFRYLQNFDDINLAGNLERPEEHHLKYLKKVYSEGVIGTVREVMDKSPGKRLKKLQKDIQSMIEKDDGLKKKPGTGSLAIYDPISIFSDCCIDKILLRTIERYNLADEIFDFSSNDIDGITKFANGFILNISHAGSPYPEIDANLEDSVEASLFNSAAILWSIRQCIVKIYEFHRWMIDKRDDEKMLDKMILEYNSFFKKEADKKSMSDSSEEID